MVSVQAGTAAARPPLAMDIYEPAEMRRALINEGVDVKVSSLNVGDYQLSEEVCIERKTVSDFFNSMYSGRLGYQLQYLCSSFRTPFLLIEGPPHYHFRPVNLKSFYGYLARLVLSSSIGLLQTSNMTGSAVLIAMMAQKLDSVPPRPRLKACKAESRNQMLLRILSAFPGIGPVLSDRILREFGSLRKVFSGQQDAVARVRGIGKWRAGEMMDLLDHIYET